MAISGPAAPARWRRSSRLAAALCACIVLLGGCATSFHGGTPPPVERLAALKPGVSTRAETIAALGTPQGSGDAALNAPRREAEDILVYQYMETDGLAMKTRTLLVFIDKRSAIYQGYMWFRAGQVLGINQ